MPHVLKVSLLRYRISIQKSWPYYKVCPFINVLIIYPPAPHWAEFANCLHHYSEVIMSTIASQITSLPIVYSTIYSDQDQRKHQSSASLAFVRGIHRWPVNSPHKWPVTRKKFPFDDVIMLFQSMLPYSFTYYLPATPHLTESADCWQSWQPKGTLFINMDWL